LENEDINFLDDSVHLIVFSDNNESDPVFIRDVSLKVSQLEEILVDAFAKFDREKSLRKMRPELSIIFSN
jgi:hypothetical protein